MDRVVGEITERLTRLLPGDKNYFTPQDLLVSEIPSFLVERVVLELKRNLADSVVPPETDWADMNSESVQKAWSAFLEAIRAETRLPSGYVKPVMESAIGDMLDLLVEPRKNIPEYLFGTQAELRYDEVVEQSRWIVVYPHFKRALPRYMEKKGLDRIDRSRCEKVIRAIDEKLTSGYSALNWAQHIEPWYQLMGTEIDSELLRRFFEDKNKPSLARRFDQEQGTVSRSRLIEIVSQPESDEPQHAENTSTGQLPPVEFNQPETDHPEQHTGDIETQSEADREAHSLIEQLGSLKAEDDQEEESGDYAYNFSNSADDTEEYQSAEEDAREEDQQENPFSLYNRGTDTAEETEPEAEEQPEEESPSDEQDDDGAVPMWQRFVGNHEDDGGLGLSRDEDEEDDDESNPIIDLQNPPDQGRNEDYEKLIEQIQDVRSYFVDELFSGDDAAFERCMEHVVTFNTWAEAAKFITQEVFRRNMVDMYSDVAVEFTDRMQTFFLQK